VFTFESRRDSTGGDKRSICIMFMCVMTDLSRQDNFKEILEER
jgi:hypothetical protein